MFPSCVVVIDFAPFTPDASSAIIAAATVSAVVRNIVGRTKHARCLNHTDRASHGHVGRTDPVCAGATPLPFSKESASTKLRSTRPSFVAIDRAFHSPQRHPLSSPPRLSPRRQKHRRSHQARSMPRATLIVPVTVTSSGPVPVCAGATPLPFSSASASAKLR